MGDAAVMISQTHQGPSQFAAGPCPRSSAPRRKACCQALGGGADGPGGAVRLLLGVRSRTIAGYSGSRVKTKARSDPGLVMRVRDARQRLELVERRRRGQGPFQGRGAFAPRVAGGLLLADEGIDHARDEHYET